MRNLSLSICLWERMREYEFRNRNINVFDLDIHRLRPQVDLQMTCSKEVLAGPFDDHATKFKTSEGPDGHVDRLPKA